MAGGFFALIFLVIMLVIYIAFLMTLNNTLKAISPANRKAEPSSVWLMLIPLFNMVWQFILYSKIKESINAEYRSKGVSDTADSTYKLGLASAIVVTVSTLINAIQARSMIAFPLSVGFLVCWIMYWVQTNNHKNKINSLPQSPNDEDSLIFSNKF